MFHRLHGDLELRQNHSGGTQRRQSFIQIAGQHFPIGAGDNRYAVLAAGIHRNQGHSRCRSFGRADGAHIDARVRESLPEPRAEFVVADFCHHADRIAEPADGNGLVGALAAVKRLKSIAGHRLARRRNPLARRNQVEIDAAHYHYGFHEYRLELHDRSDGDTTEAHHET